MGSGAASATGMPTTMSSLPGVAVQQNGEPSGSIVKEGRDPVLGGRLPHLGRQVRSKVHRLGRPAIPEHGRTGMVGG